MKRVNANRAPVLDPLLAAAETGGEPASSILDRLVLVRALRPDRLARLQLELESAAGMLTRCRRALTRCTSTRRSRRSSGAMDESVEVEVAAELVVDPAKQIAVERRGDLQRIVVGEEQIAFRFDQIGAEQQRVTRPQRLADARKQIARAAGRSKLPMFDPRNSTTSERVVDGRCGGAHDRPCSYGTVMRRSRRRSADRLGGRAISSAASEMIDQLDERESLAPAALQQREHLRRCRTRARRASTGRGRAKDVARVA